MPLPLNIEESTHTIVWSVDNKRLQDQEIKEYVQKNISYFERKLKTEITLNSDIISFNLSNHYFEEYISDQVCILETQLKSIHPLASQGINLGFADADAFCEEIINAYESKKLILIKN